MEGAKTRRANLNLILEVWSLADELEVMPRRALLRHYTSGEVPDRTELRRLWGSQALFEFQGRRVQASDSVEVALNLGACELEYWICEGSLTRLEALRHLGEGCAWIWASLCLLPGTDTSTFSETRLGFNVQVLPSIGISAGKYVASDLRGKNSQVFSTRLAPILGSRDQRAATSPTRQ